MASLSCWAAWAAKAGLIEGCCAVFMNGSLEHMLRGCQGATRTVIRVIHMMLGITLTPVSCYGAGSSSLSAREREYFATPSS